MSAADPVTLKYKELRREAPTRNIMESKHTEAATPEGRRTAFEERVKLERGLFEERAILRGLLDKRAILGGLFDERGIWGGFLTKELYW